MRLRCRFIPEFLDLFKVSLPWQNTAPRTRSSRRCPSLLPPGHHAVHPPPPRRSAAPPGEARQRHRAGNRYRYVLTYSDEPCPPLYLSPVRTFYCISRFAPSSPTYINCKGVRRRACDVESQSRALGSRLGVETGARGARFMLWSPGSKCSRRSHPWRLYFSSTWFFHFLEEEDDANRSSDGAPHPCSLLLFERERTRRWQ